MNKKGKTLVLVLSVLALVLAVRAALPYGIQWYVNDRLDRSGDYDGRIGDVDLQLFRGAYQVDNMDIVKTTGDVPVPLFSAEVADFSILWGALLDGALVGEIILHRPSLNIVDSERGENRQTGAEENWFAVVEDLFPFRIDRVAIHGGELHFRNFESEPPVDIFLSGIEGSASNLTNSQSLSETMVSSLHMDATAMGKGSLAVAMELDPSLEQPTFDLNARLLDLPVMELDAFIKAYAPFDVEAGSLDLVTEMAAQDGSVDGYVRPIIYDLKIFEWREDVERDGDNPLVALWEVLVGAASELLENQPRDQLASQVPFSGSLENPEAGVLATIGNILRNAFIEAFQANIEGSVSVDFGGEGDDNREEESDDEEASEGQ